jgi:prophage regulatory protein
MTTFVRYGGLREYGISFSRTHLLRLEAAGQFPRRVQIAPGTIGWVKSELEEFAARAVAARSAYGPASMPQAQASQQADVSDRARRLSVVARIGDEPKLSNSPRRFGRSTTSARQAPTTRCGDRSPPVPTDNRAGCVGTRWHRDLTLKGLESNATP